MRESQIGVALMLLMAVGYGCQPAGDGGGSLVTGLRVGAVLGEGRIGGGTSGARVLPGLERPRS